MASLAATVGQKATSCSFISEDFRCSFVAMFDRVDASEDRAAHAFCGGGMSGDRTTGVVRGFDRGGQFLLGKSRP